MKITKATVKSFIRKNEGWLWISNKTDFDGSVDCIMPTNDQSFTNLWKTDMPNNNNFGYKGIWFVGGSRNYFNRYEDKYMTGYECSNCCGHWIVAKYK